MPKQYSLEEMQQQIAQLESTLKLPGVPEAEKQIYRDTIQRIRDRIKAQNAAQNGPNPHIPTPTPATPIKNTTPPPPPPPAKWPPISQPMEENAQRDLQRAAANLSKSFQNTDTPHSRHIHAGNQHPVNSKQPMTATIQADHNSDPYNPAITITWADGYTLTVTETDARNRFATTFRDTCALRLVQEGRYQAMWRWSSPWRALGFYQALTAFRGTTPTLRDLDITRPSAVTATVFDHITQKTHTSV